MTSGFPVWCAECEWGLEAPEPDRKGFVRAALDRRSARMVEGLYDELAGAEVHRPGWDLARVASYLLATCVHVFTLGLVVLATVLAVVAPNVVGIGLAIFLIGLAFVIRPRFGRLGKEAGALFRADAPELFGLLDRIAAEVGAKPVYAVVATGEFNASYGVVGLRRRAVLRLGVPLWEILSSRERVALLGHELAHGANGDSRHGLIVGTSLSTLAELYNSIRPAGRDVRVNYIVDMCLRLVQTILSGLVALLFRAQLALTLRSGQRAEYLADGLAARAASSAAVAAMLDILVTSADTHLTVVHRHAANPRRSNLWDEQRAAMARIPELERERRRRAGARQRLRVDESHPPTHLRIALVKSRPELSARVEWTANQEERVQQELARDYERVARSIRDAARAALYG